MVGVERSQGAGESASADKADDEESGEDKANGEADEAKRDSQDSSEDAGEWVSEMKGPADEDSGGEADKGDSEAGEAGGDHADDGMEVFGREVTHNKSAGVSVKEQNAVTVAVTAGKQEADEGDARQEEEKGAIAEGGEQSVLPFEVGSERMGIGGPEAKSGDGEQNRAASGKK